MIWQPEKFVAFDVETSGDEPEYALQPWRVDTNEAWLTSMAIIEHVDGQLVANGSKLAPTPADVRAFLQRAIDEDLTVVAWYATFDISWCVAYGCADLVHKVRWLDGMLLWRHLSIEPEYDTDRGKRKSYSLKMAVPEFMPVEHHDYNEDIDFHDESPEARAKLLKYNNRDAVYTWVLTRQFWHELTPRQLNAALIEASCLSLVAEANYTGMLVDTLACRSLNAKLENTAARMLEKLKDHGVTETIVRSPMKLAGLMYDEWKLPVLKENVGAKTGKISRATDKEVLHELAFVDPRCADLRSYREALGNKTKFADAPLAAAAYNGDGRARPSAIVFGTYTGRMTYSSKQGKGVNELQTGFALHQEKRGSEFRSIIVPPPGYALMEVDAGGQEFRWMAELSGDVTMKKLCLPGEDMHSYMGASIVGEDYRTLISKFKAEDKDAEQTRYLGKVANLSLQYRTFPKTFRKVARVQYNIPMELPTAQRIHATYKQTYRDVPRYWENQIRKTRGLGYVETLAGRRVNVVGNWEGSMSWKMESTSLNYPVQGTGGDQKYLAMRVLKDYLPTIGAYFAWDLHDGIFMYVPEAMVDRAAVEIRHLLDNLPYPAAWGFTPDIPLPWDVKLGWSWGTLKEVKHG